MRFLITLLLFLYCCSGNEKQVVDVPYNNPRTNRLLLQGSDALKQHNFMQALALADSADKYAVQKADIHFFKGRVYSELGRFAEAEQAYKNALKAVPGYRGRGTTWVIMHTANKISVRPLTIIYKRSLRIKHLFL